MKTIRINDTLYEQIKATAELQKRSLQGQVEYMITSELPYYSTQPRGAVTMTKGIDPAYVNMEYPKISETISKIASNVARKQNIFAAVGIRTTTESNLDLQNGKAVITIKPNEEDVKTYKEKVQSKKDDKTYDFCKHDAVKGFCRSGCK